jgi:predicted  nucleic acid-binding Zn-ribbon protein
MKEDKPQTPPRKTSNPNRLLAELQAFIKRCHDLLDEGKEPDLTGMDEQVDRVCKAIMEMPGDQAEKMTQKMENVARELSQLGDELDRKKKQINDQMNSLSQQQQANTAYKNAGKTVPQSVKATPDSQSGS